MSYDFDPDQDRPGSKLFAYVLMVFSKSFSLSMYAQLSSGARGLILGLSLHLLSYIVHVNREGSGKFVHLQRLI